MFLDTARSADVIDLPADEVAAGQFAVDGQVEVCKVMRVVCHLEPDGDGPHVFRQKRTLLTNDPPLVPKRANFGYGRKSFVGHGSSPVRPAHHVLGLSDDGQYGIILWVQRSRAAQQGGKQTRMGAASP